MGALEVRKEVMMPILPLISHIRPMPRAFLLIVVAGILILVANMIYSLARERKKLDRRTIFLKRWVSIESTQQPRIQYRKVEIRLPKP